jgi:hypothetical protein
MDADERRIAIQEGSYADAVKHGYPVLMRLGQELRGRGVNFLDLTNVYARTREPMYVDNCCHVNPTGLRLVIAAIAKSIGAALKPRT